jgi:hypothetical protein
MLGRVGKPETHIFFGLSGVHFEVQMLLLCNIFNCDVIVFDSAHNSINEPNKVDDITEIMELASEVNSFQQLYCIFHMTLIN